MKMKLVHGVVSLSLIGVALVIATLVMIQTSWLWAGIYLGMSGIAAAGIVFGYCAKCPARECCAHVLPGKLAALRPRDPGPYTRGEVAVVVIALLVILGMPQPWLLKQPLWLAIFWVLNGMALVDILTCVCRTCGNVNCPVRRVAR